MKVRQADFSKGSVPSLILKVSFPLIVAELVNLLYSMVDRIYIGHIEDVGSSALTGLGLCFPIISLISAFSRLLGFNGGAPLAAIYRGKKDRKEAEAIMGNSFLMAVITGIMITVLLLVFMRPVLYLFGASDNTYPYARDYLSIYVCGTVFSLVSLTLNAFINSQGFQKIGMMTVIVGAVSNIILDPVFIFLLDMGVKGAAIATVISQSLSAFFAFFFLRSSSVELRLTVSGMHLCFSRCCRIITLGLSGFTMGATNSIVQLVCNKTAFIWGGDLYVGVMTILNSIREIFSTPINGLSSAGGPVMSYNYGSRDYDRVKKASNTLLFSILIYSTFVWLFVFLFPRLMALMFTHDEALLAVSAHAIRLYFFGFIFMAFQMSGQQTFVSLGLSGPAIFFSLFRKVIIVVPLTIFLPYILSTDGIMIAEAISNVVGGISAYTAMRIIVFNRLLKKEEHFCSP